VVEQDQVGGFDAVVAGVKSHQVTSRELAEAVEAAHLHRARFIDPAGERTGKHLA
jgi:hypothetical protein